MTNRASESYRKRRYPGKPPRLGAVFSCYDPPLYFITFNVYRRRRCLDNEAVNEAIMAFVRGGIERGYGVGRYVVMPDHIHLFVRVGHGQKLGRFVGSLKQAISRTDALKDMEKPHWQPGFFDHMMRRHESYAEKWHYVRNNPVRAGLVNKPEDWPFQGEVYRLEM